MKSKHEILIDIGTRKLIYPVDYTFISDLDSLLAKKWLESEWDLDNTVMLELKHLTIPANQPAQTGIPSDIFAGLIFNWTEQVFFRVVAFSRAL